MDASFHSAERLRDVVACVTHGRLLVRGLPDGSGDRRLQFPDRAPIRANGALRGGSILVTVTLQPGGDVAAYAYSLHGPGGTELLAWHWHPVPEFPAPVHPHLHVSSSLRIAGPSGERGLLPLDKRHLPTGVVSLSAFVRMLIEEFGVEPLARDWQARLAGG